MLKLVLLRHGESQWNLENRFTGWVDVDLTEKGIAEAKAAGQKMKEEGFQFDMAYTSVLKRAIKTLHYALEEMDGLWIPEVKDWHLNERHYGALQGLNKSETAEQYGEEQVKIWRRSYDVPPPALTDDHPLFPGHDARYKGLSYEELPHAESLEITAKRVLPYWETTLLPTLQSGKTLLIVAHGNSLRALVQHLDGLTKEQVLELNIPTGVPLAYELTDEGKKITSRYLMNEQELKDKMDAVAAQGSANVHNVHG